MWKQLILTEQPKVEFDTLDINIPMPTDIVKVPYDWFNYQSDLIAILFRSETDEQFDDLLEDLLRDLEPSPVELSLEDTIDPLGIYSPMDKLIKIDENKIHRCSEYMRTQGALVEFDQLSKIVRTHEDSHALHHLAGDPQNKNKIWDKFKDNPPCVLEMLAQLFTYDAIRSDSGLLNAFDELKKRQSWVYHLWGKFRESPKENVYWRARNKPDQIKKLLKGMGFNCPSKVRYRKKIGPTATSIPVVQPGAYYMVNTCRKYDPLIYQDMLANQKASAYGDRRYAVNKINRDDTVFLYHSEVGVIAFGRALEGCKKDDVKEEYQVPLKFHWKIDPSKEPQRAVTAQETNHALGSKYTFMQAVWSISEEMARVIRDIASVK